MAKAEATVEELVTMIERGELRVREMQRRYVWRSTRVRDLVDSRPHLIGLFMPLALVVVASVLVPVPAVQQYMSLFSLAMLMTMVAEGVYLGLTVTRKARVKFPNEDINGLATGWYSFTRASQPRKLRMPKPRVQRGANP